MMIFSQKDPKWSDLTIGRTKYTLSRFGCYIVSLSMLADKTPDIVLDLLNKNGCFTDDGLLLSYSAGKVLDMPYLGACRTTEGVCIAETHHFASEGYPQHFFVYLNDGNILDPLTGTERPNPYSIYSFRLFDLSKKGMGNVAT